MRYRTYRFPCDYPVTVQAAHLSAAARLINVSADGARLTGVDGLHPGTTLKVQLGACGLPRMAEVRWSRDGVAGLRFATPLGPRDLAVIRQAGGHTAMPGPTAPRDCLLTRQPGGPG